MQSRRPRKNSRFQTLLFTRRPMVPRWSDLPPQVKEPLRHSLAQLLRQQRDSEQYDSGKDSNER